MEFLYSEANSVQGRDSRSVRDCYCGELSPIRILGSDDKPGRRFFGCPNYLDPSKKCKFFEWIDEEISERSKRIVTAARLRSYIKDLETELERRNMKIGKLVQQMDNPLKKNECLKRRLKKVEVEGWKKTQLGRVF